VVATDYVPTLLDRARERADAERLRIEFREADAESVTDVAAAPLPTLSDVP
jgi:ubiquinone/menaquinone biosynthesis C-methylase UbiE